VADVVHFALLGPVQAWHGETEIDLGIPQQRALLALLLLRAGRPVPMDEITDLLWPDSAPASAAGIVHSRVSGLRQILPTGTLTRSASGYRLDLAAESLDWLRFQDLVAAARSAKATDPDHAAALLTEAMHLRRGPVAADLPGTVRSSPVFAEAERRVATAALEAAELASGRDNAYDLLPSLRSMAIGAPFDEPMYAALMRLLAAVGRTAEAIQHFHDLRARLADELGVDPSPELAATYQQILRTGSGRVASGAGAAVRPAQLPLDLATFSGRGEHAKRIIDYLGGDRPDPATARVAVIVGMGGIGKTSLAVHCAHRVAEWYSDGQLYVNMRGFDPSATPVRPQEVLRGFLIALGVPDADLPADFELQVALYRSRTAERRIMVVLDNVRDAEQARPLLPSGPGCGAIVTSRDQLSALIIHAAALLIPLEPMSSTEARALLQRRLGGRLAAEPKVADLVIASCGGLPLALSIFSARAITHAHFTLHQLLGELTATRDGFDPFGLTDGIHDLRAVFSWSYRLLGDGAARLFRLLSLHPGQIAGCYAAASLAGHDVPHTVELLAELRCANLITEIAPGLFRMHDLVRTYSAELLRLVEETGARHQAGRRLLDHYLHSSLRAAARINVLRQPETVQPAPVVDGVSVEPQTGYQQAVEWFCRERPALLGVIALARELGTDPPLWQLAWAMENFLQRHQFWIDWEHTQKVALAAARRSGDLPAQARARHSLGTVYSARAMNLPDRARSHLFIAIELFGRCGDLVSQGHCHLRIADLPDADDWRHHVEEALRLYAEAERRDGYTSVPDYIAVGYWKLGRYAQALPYAVRGVELMRRSGDSHREASGLANLAKIRSALGDRIAALAAQERSVMLFAEAGDLFMAARQLQFAGERSAAQRRHLAATVSLRRALSIFEALGSNRAGAVRAALRELVAR